MSKKRIRKSDISWPINYKHCFHITFDKDSRTFSGIPPQWLKFLSVDLINNIPVPITKIDAENNQSNICANSLIKLSECSSNSSSYKIINTPLNNPNVSINDKKVSNKFNLEILERINAEKKPLQEDFSSLFQFKHSKEVKSFIGTQKFNSKQVYVKCQVISQQNQLESFSKEIEILSSLNHGNIIKFVGCYFEEINDNLITLTCVTEFLSGGSLSDLITSNIKFNERIVSYLAGQILSGLLYLHSKGLMHRNLMSDSILFNSFTKPKITDFSNCESVLNEFRTVFEGTVYWMSPELLQGKSYGTKVDIWAFGMILVEIIDGEPLNFSLEPEKALHIIKTIDQPLKPVNKVSVFLECFIENCLQPEPNKRFNAKELLQSYDFMSMKVSEDEYQMWFNCVTYVQKSTLDQNIQ